MSDELARIAEALERLAPKTAAATDWLSFGASSLLNDVLLQRQRMTTGHYSGPDYLTID